MTSPEKGASFPEPRAQSPELGVVNFLEPMLLIALKRAALAVLLVGVSGFLSDSWGSDCELGSKRFDDGRENCIWATDLAGSDLAGSLQGLVEAADRTAHADRYDMQVRDGTVAVTIRIDADSEALSGLIDTKVSRRDDRIDAWVEIDDLAELAEREEVRFVQPPQVAEPHE